MLERCPTADALYRRLVSHWEPGDIMPASPEPRRAALGRVGAPDFPELLDRMQFLDLVTYLPDDILTKVDRASMAIALEARVPLLDHRVVELAWRLPHSAKMRGGVTQVAAAPGALPPRAAGADRAAQDGLRRSARRMAARVRCATGRKTCSREKRLREAGCRRPARSPAAGRNTWPDGATGNTCCGTS